jgi:hypothetical protein
MNHLNLNPMNTITRQCRRVSSTVRRILRIPAFRARTGLSLWRAKVEQLCFFKFPRPLLERFGKAFFSDVPRGPGVYVFSGENNRPLYVGHSRNLRLRLSYYKNAQPEREPKRIVRLVHQVQKIEMECCDTVAAAQLRELALIRQLRPRFNVANTLSPTFSFFALRDSADGWVLRLSMSQARQDGEMVIGGFKNRGLCARAFLAIGRTVVAAERGVETIYDFPASLNHKTRQWQFAPEWGETIRNFITADDPKFIERTANSLETARDPFLRQIFESDLLTLTEFYELAREMAGLRTTHESKILSQEALQVSQRLQKPAPENDPPSDFLGEETIFY